MKDSTPRSDFNRNPKTATPDALVSFLTEYGMTVTPEEAERQLLRAYGPDRLPGTESRRRSQMGLLKHDRTPKPHGECEQCGDSLTWGVRFCSQDCYREWVQDQKPEPPTREELIAQMQAALDALREVIE